MKFHIIHGIHTSEGDQSTPARLIPDLERLGHEIVIHDYGYVYAITSRFKNKGRAKKIAPKINEGDVIIAHSNGCDIVRRMLIMGIKPSGIILLQPALDSDTEFEKGDYWINVFHNEDDGPVLWAKWLLWFGHPYGAMGRYGYKGNDSRIKNYDTIKLCNEGGHSAPYRSQRVRNKVINSYYARI